MERLTKTKNKNGFVSCEYEDADCNDSCMYSTCKWRRKAIVRLAEYEDTGMTPDQIKEMPDAVELCKISIALKKLKDYETKEKQGLLTEFPCKVGDTVYTIWSETITSQNKRGGKIDIVPAVVKKIEITAIGICFTINCLDTEYRYHNNAIGDSVFMSYEEAEKVLDNDVDGSENHE